MIYLCVGFIICSGYANGYMDHLMFHDSEYDPKKTWRNKYKKDSEGNLFLESKSPWYYLGLYRPKYVEKFPFSTTLLVWLTDPWHKYKMICFASLRTALVLSIAINLTIFENALYNILTYIGVWIGLWAFQALGFHIKYTWIK